MSSSSARGNGVTPGTDRKTGQAVPVIRHHLPQVPTPTQHPRLAVSKTNNHDADSRPQQYANIVPMETVCRGRSFGENAGSPADVSRDLPTAPSGGVPMTEPPAPFVKSLPPQGSTHIPSPPIKLRIRRSFHEGTLCSRSSPLPHEQPSPVPPTHPVAPPPPLPVVSAAAGFAPTRFGRAKTKGDIKKQLMEKKRDRKMQEASRDAAVKQESVVRGHLVNTGVSGKGASHKHRSQW